VSVLPLPLLLSWFLGLLVTFALIFSAWTIYHIARRRRRRLLTKRERRIIVASAIVMLFCLAGRPIVLLFYHSGDGPEHRASTNGTFLDRPDGARLHVQSEGPAGAGTIVLTHGWGADSDMWQYARRDLAGRYRVVTWDLRGLGDSTEPRDRNYSLDAMADDLHAVVGATSGPVVLAGHSIGGMINLTYARRHPADLDGKVVGIVEMNSTYTNPVRTTRHGSLATKLQKPVAEPLLHATIALSPVVRVINTLRYWSGVSHIQNASQSFAGTETRGQVDFVSRYEVLSSPAVVARGALAMFHWDATEVLDDIPVPVLLIAGPQDTTTLPAASEDMRTKLPHARMALAGPAKHMGPIERNHEYDAAILAFAQHCFTRDNQESRRAEPSSGN